MNQTDDRGYPYPECRPPYVEDAADLPLQLKNLAEAVDDDVTALSVQAADALNPPAALIESTTPQAPLAGAAFDYTTTVFATNPAIPNLLDNALVCTSSGLYLVTGTCASSANNNTNAHQLVLLVNNQAVQAETIRNGSAAGEQLRNTVTGFVIMNVNDRLTMIQSNSLAITYQFVRLGMVRVVAL